MINKIFFILLIIIFVGAWARCYKFTNPVLDWHSWRQADTSSVSRTFVKQGFDILHPKFDDLSIGVSLLDNPKGYRFVEFPFYNVLQAESFILFDHFTLEEWGRIISIASSLLTIIFLYLLVGKNISSTAGFFAAGFFALCPYEIYYGRTLLPDNLMVAFLISGIYFFDKWHEKKSNILFFIISLIFTACSVLMKPFVLFFGLSYLAIAYNKYGLGFVKRKELYIFAFFSILPFIFWRLWMSQFPEGIPQSNWLFNGTEIRFKGAFFQWLFADRISRLILGYFGLPFVVLGALIKVKKEGYLFISMIISSLIYLFVIATGNVQHDYYQMLIVPTIAIFFGIGVDFILKRTKDYFSIYISYLAILISLLFSFSFSWFLIRDYYNLQHYDAYFVGGIADKILPKNAKVIAPFGGDTSFLYYTNRSGWPVVDRSFYKFIKAGADYIVFVDPSKDDLHLGTLFNTTSKGENYIIFDLKRPTKEGLISLKLDEAKESSR